MVKLSKEDTVVCKYCQRRIKKGARHQCAQMRAQNQPARRARDDDEDFFVSFAIAYATDNWALGLLGGRSLMGAIIGDALADDVDYNADEIEYDFHYSGDEVVDEELPPIDELGEQLTDDEFTQEPDSESVEMGDVDDTPGDTSDSY